MKFTKKLTAVLFGVLLVSCSSNAFTPDIGSIERRSPVINDRKKPVISQTFKCGSKEYIVSYVTKNIIYLIEKDTNEKFQLDQVISASGSRYSDGNIEIHIKGNEAILNNGGDDISCREVK